MELHARRARADVSARIVDDDRTSGSLVQLSRGAPADGRRRGFSVPRIARRDASHLGPSRLRRHDDMEALATTSSCRDCRGDGYRVEAEVQPGQYFYIEKGGIETARNIGKRRYREIAIELKD